MKGKVLLLLAIVLAFSASVFAQRTTVTDVLQLPSSNGKKVSSIMTDTTLTGATDAMLVSARAVKKYVDSRSGGSITQPVIYSVGLGSPLPSQPVPAGSAAIQIIDVNGNKALHLSNGVSWVSVGELLGVKNVDSLNITPGEIKLVHIGRNGATTGQVLKWNGTAWAPSSDATAPTGAAGGDLNSNYPNPTVVAIQGHPLSNAVPLPGQTLIWDGGSWNPTAPPGAAHEYADAGCLAPTVVPDPIVGPFLAWNTDCLEQWRWNGTEWVIDGSPTGTFYTSTQFSGNGESGTPLRLAQNGASTGQVMKWNGTVWAPGTDATGGGGVVEPVNQVIIGTGSGTTSDADNTYNPITNVAKMNGVLSVGTGDTLGKISVAPGPLGKVGIYTKLSGGGNRIYNRVKNPSAGWNTAGYFDWWEMAVNGGASVNGRNNFSPAPADTLPNVVWRRGLIFDQAPSMYESDETNWWGSGFIGPNLTAPRNVFEKHWQVIDSAGFEHRPLTGYFEKRSNGYGSLGVNVSLMAFMGWKYGQDGIITLNRNSEVRYGQASFFKDSLRTLNLNDLSKNSVLHLASANRGIPDPNGRATFLTIGGNGAFSNVIGIGSLYTNTNNSGDLDAIFTTQTGSTQIERVRIKGGQTAVGIGTTNPQQELDVNGDILAKSMRINSTADSAGLIVKYSSLQTTPIFKLQNQSGSDLAYFHMFNPSSNPTLTLGRISSIAATSANNTVVGLTNAAFTAFNGNNTLVGFNTAGTSYNGYENTYIGSNCGRNTSDGYQNVLIGYLAGGNLTTGYQNMFLGRQAGLSCVSGWASSAIGANALSSATVPSDFVAVGSQSAQSATTASGSVVLGAGAGRSKTSITGSVLIGTDVSSQAGTVIDQLWIDNSNTITPLIKGSFSQDTLRVFGALKSGLENLATTSSIFELINTSGKTRFFRTTINPNSVITASVGDVAYGSASSVGATWVKETGNNTNTGWVKVQTATDVLEAVAMLVVSPTTNFTATGVVADGAWRVPAKFNGWTLESYSVSLYTAGSGSGSIVLQVQRATPGGSSSSGCSMAFAAGDVQKDVTGCGLILSTGDMLRLNVGTNDFSTPAQGVVVTYVLKP